MARRNSPLHRGGGETPAGAELRPGERRHEVVGGGEAAGGLAVDGDQAGVASELADVVPDPGQRHHLRTREYYLPRVGAACGLAWSRTPALPGTSSVPSERKPRGPSLYLHHHECRR